MRRGKDETDTLQGRLAVTSRKTLEQKLGEIFSAEEVSTSDARLSTQFTVFPTSLEQVSELVRLAKKERISLLPIGGTTRLYKPARPLDVAVSLTNLPSSIEHSPEDMTATVSAGMTLSRVQNALKKWSQTIPLDPPSVGQSTVGGVISANAFGPRCHRYGTARDCVVGTTLINDEGNIVKAGARVVKNVSGYDLNKIYIGSRGTLGILVAISFKLHPSPERRVCFVSQFQTAEEALEAADTIRKGPLPVESLTVASGEWSPQPENGWTLILELAGSRKSLVNQEKVVRSLGEESGFPLLRTPIQIRKKVNQGGEDNHFQARISLSKKNLRSFSGSRALRRRGEVSVKLFPGAGLCYIKMPADSDETEKELREILEEVESHGGMVEFETLPENSALDRWPILPASFPWMKKMKEALDPHGIFAPGTFVGGI